MDTKINSQIIYIVKEEIDNYLYNPYEIKDYATQEVKFVIIQDLPEKDVRKIKIDVLTNSDLWGGYIVGFFYPDGKFLGHFHYTIDSKKPKESITGTFEEIADDYIIKGLVHEIPGPDCGFFLKLGKNSDHKKDAQKVRFEISPLTLPKQIKPVKNNNTLSISFFDKKYLDALLLKSETIKRKRSENYNLYDHISKWKPEPGSVDDLLLAISVAYSWMPTMLDIYVKDKKEFAQLLKPIKELGKIKSVALLDANEDNIIVGLTQLSKAINNSLVGTSKVLHIFFPEFIPIIDRRVLKSWNKEMKKHYKKYPETILPLNIPTSIDRQVRMYINYWRLLLAIKENLKLKSVRQVEEPFYWLGGV